MENYLTITKQEVKKHCKFSDIDIFNAPEYKLKFQNKIEDASTQMKISDLLRDNYDFDNMDGNKLKFYNSLRRNLRIKIYFMNNLREIMSRKQLIFFMI